MGKAFCNRQYRVVVVSCKHGWFTVQSHRAASKGFIYPLFYYGRYFIRECCLTIRFSHLRYKILSYLPDLAVCSQ